MTTMSKCQFEVIATAMQASHPVHCNGDANKHAQWDVCVSRLADHLAATNGMFKRERFIRACQPGSNVRART